MVCEHDKMHGFHVCKVEISGGAYIFTTRVDMIAEREKKILKEARN